MRYEDVVPYHLMDPVKRAGQKAAAETAHFMERFGFKELTWTRGESVYLFRTPLGIVGFVIEGLGTKNLVADTLHQLDIAQEYQRQTGLSLFGNVAICNGAMVFNDMITLGTLPVVFGIHLSVGHGDWFKDETVGTEIIEGTKTACFQAKCTWGPGETPTLRGIIFPETEELSGSAMGWLPAHNYLYDPQNIADGDVIVLVGSSGIHANGLTTAREIAAKLPEGYLTRLDDGRLYGETLLDPTFIYVSLIEECQRQGIPLRYVVNITGHGWRKLMRAVGDFTYVIDKLPDPQTVFQFIQERGPVEVREMYGNYNMGAGLALYVHPDVVGVTLEAAESQGFKALVGGYITKGEKKVVLEPLGLEYKADTLEVR